LGVTIERRDAETKVLQASKLASIGELAAGVGHEINNPVNGIINCADILLETLEGGSKNHQFAELVRSEADRIAKIVRNLLTFSRQDRERHSPARLCDVVEAVLSLSRKKIAKSHVELTVNVPEDLPKLKCRSEQLQQVFMNLIINALHSLDDKYPQDNAKKKLNIIGRRIEFDGEPWIRLTIEDFGGGISPVHMERLFDPFFTTKGRDRGTGLGLSVSDGIVKDHGGHISVDSELGQYARFHVDMPLDNGWQIEDDETGRGGE
jgi:signal transduction histidine kinase